MLDKKYRSTVAVVIIFFALLGFVYLFEKGKESKVEVEEKSGIEEVIDVISFPGNDVVKVEIKNQDGDLTLEKREEKWVLVQDEGIDVNELQVTTLVKDFNDLEASSKLSFENADDFGLETPGVSFKVTTITDDSYTLSFGEPTLGGYSYYARINEDNDAFVVSATFMQKLIGLSKDSFRLEVDTENADLLDK